MNKETLKVGEDLKHTNQLFKIDVRISLSKVSNSNRFSKKYIKNEHVLYIRKFYFQDNLYTTVL